MNDVSATFERLAARGHARGADAVLRAALEQQPARLSDRPNGSRYRNRVRRNSFLAGAALVAAVVIVVAVVRAGQGASPPQETAAAAALEHRFSLRPIVKVRPLPCDDGTIPGAGGAVGCYVLGPVIATAGDVESATAVPETLKPWDVKVVLKPDAADRVRAASGQSHDGVAAMISGSVRATLVGKEFVADGSMTLRDPSFAWPVAPFLADFVSGRLGSPGVPYPTKGRSTRSGRGPNEPNYFHEPDYLVLVDESLAPIGYMPNWDGLIYEMAGTNNLTCAPPGPSVLCDHMQQPPNESSPEPVYGPDLFTVIGHRYPNVRPGFTPLGSVPPHFGGGPPPTPIPTTTPLCPPGQEYGTTNGVAGCGVPSPPASR